MKKLALLLLVLCCCDNRGVASQPEKRVNVTHLGSLDGCTEVMYFEDGNNRCYLVHYCGSGNDSISCVKNEVASSK